MNEPPLMSSLVFIARTTKPGSVVRSHLLPIDNALRKLEFSLVASRAKKILRARALLAACAVWRAGKAHKLIAGAANFSQNTADRAVVVDLLADQAMARLKYYVFEEQKAHRPAHVPAAAANRRGLQHGHQHERGVYAQGKAFARLQNAEVPVNFPGGSLVDANMLVAANPAQAGAHGALPPPVAAILNAGLAFNQLNQAQFATLAAFFGMNNMSMQQPVHYARKEERINEHMCVVVGGLLQKEPGVNYTTASDMWAMDKYGNFMCTGSQAQVQAQGGNYQFNHSSLNAGHDVLCAGVVVITNGVIMGIDNNSGHYRPTRQNLHTAVQVLHHDLGATFDANCVIRSYATPQRRFNNWMQFLGNVNAPGQWP